MRVLLVQHCPNSFAQKSCIPEPLAFEILTSTIPNHDVEIFDMRLDNIRLCEEIESFRPDIVGAGCITAGYYECINVLKETKTLNPEIITVVGGHHPTVMPKDFAKDFIDFIVIGEGEKTFPELIDSLEQKKDPSTIKGLAIPEPEDFYLPKRDTAYQLNHRYAN